jgi:hypothetical protein
MPVVLMGLFLSPTMSATAMSDDFAHDLMLTVLARKALLDDRELAGLNLGVKVSNRVATLWGAVPSPLVADRALRRLTSLTDIVQVNNAMHIAVVEEEMATSVPALPRPPAAPATLTTLLPLDAGVGRPASNPAKPATEMPRMPNAPLPSETAWQAVRAAQDPRMPDHRELEVVLPSLRLPTPPLADPAAVARDRTLEGSVNELRQERRFRNIDVKVKNSTVTLTGDPTPSLYDFAHAVSHLPGVGRVIVKERP